jgi:hypothetical protein
MGKSSPLLILIIGSRPNPLISKNIARLKRAQRRDSKRQAATVPALCNLRIQEKNPPDYKDAHALMATQGLVFYGFLKGNFSASALEAAAGRHGKQISKAGAMGSRFCS